SLAAFTIEAWTYLGIDIVVVAIRFIARWWQLGLRDMKPDDFLMVIAILLYTAETATAHYVGAVWNGLANSGYRAALDPSSREYFMRVEGSKTQLFGWLVYITLLWVLKLAWLFFFKRLGDGVGNMSLKINIGFVFVGLTFFATFFGILFVCWPVHQHWQIYPNPGNVCQTAVSRTKALIVITTNLATDFYIITIPMPMIWSARIAMSKKVGLCVMFCGGFVTAVFGGLRCGYVLGNNKNGPQLTGEWSCRESFVAVLVTNIPVLFPIILSAFRSANGKISSYGQSSTKNKALGETKNDSRFKMTTLSKKNKKFNHPLSLPAETMYTRFGSEEEIIGTPEGAGGAPVRRDANPTIPEEDIKVTTEWHVHSMHMDADGIAREKKNREMGFH
ncbi:hypothetical protein QBC40DRAFT_320773, partial [Triangularia verruculosa]